MSFLYILSARTGPYYHLSRLFVWVSKYSSGSRYSLSAEGYLHETVNILLKYADDTSSLVPSDSNTDLVDEFDNIKRSAAQNHMVINLQKNQRTCLPTTQSQPRLVVLPVPLDQIEQVHCAKLLGIYLSDALQFETHLVNVLKICSVMRVRAGQRIKQIMI